jgi:hypothetical protein
MTGEVSAWRSAILSQTLWFGAAETVGKDRLVWTAVAPPVGRGEAAEGEVRRTHCEIIVGWMIPIPITLTVRCCLVAHQY